MLTTTTEAIYLYSAFLLKTTSPPSTSHHHHHHPHHPHHHHPITPHAASLPFPSFHCRENVKTEREKKLATATPRSTNAQSRKRHPPPPPNQASPSCMILIQFQSITKSCPQIFIAYDILFEQPPPTIDSTNRKPSWKPPL